MNDGLGGYYTAHIDKKGNTTMKAVEGKDIKDADDKVKAFYNNLNTVIKEDKTVKMNVLNGDDYVVVGDFDKEAIDMQDLNAFSNIINTSGERDATSIQGKLAHEIAEQYGKQINGMGFKQAHTELGIPAENNVTGSLRGEDYNNISLPLLEVRPTSYTINNKQVVIEVHQDEARKSTTIKQKPRHY